MLHLKPQVVKGGETVLVADAGYEADADVKAVYVLAEVEDIGLYRADIGLRHRGTGTDVADASVTPAADIHAYRIDPVGRHHLQRLTELHICRRESHRPALCKAVDDLIYDYYGEDNPSIQQDYEPMGGMTL